MSEIILEDYRNRSLMKLNETRLIALEDGYIVNVNGVNLEFEGKLFYEVKEDENELFGNYKWKRTGKILTPQEVNKL